jgi:hypothetical protein
MPKKKVKRVNLKKTLSSRSTSSTSTSKVLINEKAVGSSEPPVIDKSESLRIDEIENRAESEPQEKSNVKLYILGGVMAGIIVIAVVALFISFSTQLEQEKNREARIGVTPMPTIALRRALVRDDWSFEVLNGSGVAGAAKKAADKIEVLGYKVIDMGNAESSNSSGNKLYVTADMIDRGDLLIADLRADFNIASVSGEFKSSSTASARLIIGKPF